jgi:hypothetical protein
MKWINSCPLPVEEGDSLGVSLVLGVLILLNAEMKIGLMIDGSQPLAISHWKNSLVMEMKSSFLLFCQSSI